MSSVSLHHAHIGSLAPDTAGLVGHVAEEIQGVLSVLDATRINVNKKALEVLSFSSCVTFFTGVVATVRGAREYLLGRQIDDLGTQIRGGLHTAAGGFEVGAGTAYIGMSGATLYYFATAAHIAHVAAQALEKLGGALVGVATVFYAMYWAVEAVDLFLCKQKLSRFIAEGGGPKKVGELIREDLQDPAAQIQWQRALGGELYHKVIDSKEPLSQEMVDRLQMQVNKKLALASFYSVLSVAAAVVTGLALTSTVAMAPWLFSAIAAGIGVIWVLNDLVGFAKDLETGEVMNWEKAWVYFSTLFCIGAVVASLLLSQQVLSLAIALAVGTLIFVVHYCAIRKIHSHGPESSG